MNLYTFLLRFLGCEACSQYQGKTINDALKLWGEKEIDRLCGDDGSMFKAKHARTLKRELAKRMIDGIVQVGSYVGIKNIWFVSMLVGKSMAHLYIVKTAK